MVLTKWCWTRPPQPPPGHGWRRDPPAGCRCTCSGPRLRQLLTLFRPGRAWRPGPPGRPHGCRSGPRRRVRLPVSPAMARGPRLCSRLARGRHRSTRRRRGCLGGRRWACGSAFSCATVVQVLSVWMFGLSSPS